MEGVIGYLMTTDNGRVCSMDFNETEILKLTFKMTMESNNFIKRDLCSTGLNNLTIRVPNPISSLVCVLRKLFDEKGSLKNWLKERKKEALVKNAPF